MAITNTPQYSKLSVKVRTGLNSAGNPVYSTLNYSNVKATATITDMYIIGQGIGNLQAYPVTSIIKTDVGYLINA